jgi:DNA-cytosine methyltransferase
VSIPISAQDRSGDAHGVKTTPIASGDETARSVAHSAFSVGSLFSGVGGFDMGFLRAGFDVRWQCEIDPSCQDVLRRQFPETDVIYSNIETMPTHQVERVDVLIGGFPCQDLSVAGRRAGLDGSRSGLFFEFMRVAEALRPSWIVLENVPGLLSSNDGADMDVVMDTLENLRYIVDCDIIDAQFFGVPQRRRRVFIVCQSIESILTTKTRSSALTICQCLTEILHAILEEAKAQSLIGHSTSDLSRCISVDGLTRRMQLFGLPTENARWSMLLESWDGENRRSSAAIAHSDSVSGDEPHDVPTLAAATSSGMDSGESPTPERRNSSLNTAPSWKSLLDDLCGMVKSCITSTGTRTITASVIYTCALMSERIASLTCQLNDSSPSYWSAASSALALIEGFTNYARQTSHSLFTAVEWIQPWIDFTHRAARLQQSLSGSTVRSWGEILALPEGLQGHPAPRREAGENVAASLTSGSHPNSNRPGRHGEDDVNLALCLTAHEAKGGDPTVDNYIVAKAVSARGHASHREDSDTYITHSLHDMKHGVSEDGTGRGVPLIAFNWTNDGGGREAVSPTLRVGTTGMGTSAVAFGIDSQRNVTAQGMGPLTTTGSSREQAVAFAQNQRGELRTSAIAPQLTTGGGKPGEGYPAVFGMADDTAYCLRPAPGSVYGSGSGDGGINTTMVAVPDVAGTLMNPGAGGRTTDVDVPNYLPTPMGVRRLTPTECERLMSFPDDWTRWGASGKEMSDSTRYRMCGNGVVSNVAEYIAHRIAEVLHD